jgi:hypothetical protein
MPNLLTTPTQILDFNTPEIQNLIQTRGWRNLAAYDQIGAIYEFVRNDIVFGYNTLDALPASRVLRDGYGQCNTKANVLMALLRAVDIPCRLRGSTIRKALQRGFVPAWAYPLAPQSILHTWVEVSFEDRWIGLEGVILDDPLIQSIQTQFKDTTQLCGYGVGTDQLHDPKVVWRGEDTQIQSTGINADFGVFETPDAFYERFTQFSPLKQALYSFGVRHWMNRNVRKWRNAKPPVRMIGAPNR